MDPYSQGTGRIKVEISGVGSPNYYSEPLTFSELAETGSRQIIHISIRVLG